MRIDHVDPANPDQVRACFEVNRAASQADQPGEPSLTEQVFGGWLAVGWGGDPREVWQAGYPAAGWYRLGLPDKENLGQANLDLVVHPAHRRRGIGRALLRHAAARAAARQRSLLAGEARASSPGEAFARSAGARPGLVSVQRMQELGPPGARLREQAGLREQAERAAGGYSLTSWTGLIPDEHLEQVAALYTALNDAPHDPGTEPEVWDEQRIRERINGLRPRYGIRTYAVAALKRGGAAGEMAALTEVAVEPADPRWGFQMLTAVIREHRGHRLGLLVKAAMLELLTASEPELERIVTWNAGDNEHMIAVNQALGYTILGQPAISFRGDAAALAR